MNSNPAATIAINDCIWSINQGTAIFWDMMPRSLVDTYWRFRGTCYFSPDNERSSCLRKSVRWWMQHVSLERWYISTRLHEIKFWNTAFVKPPYRTPQLSQAGFSAPLYHLYNSVITEYSKSVMYNCTFGRHELDRMSRH